MSDRLFAYDQRIVGNSIRVGLASWQDRLTVGIALLIVLVGARASLAHRPMVVATWVAIAAGGVAGVTAGRLLASRLAFHAFDGPLPADAVRMPTRVRYLLAWHAIALALLILVTVAARPSLVGASLPAYVAGALLGGATLGVGVPSPAVPRLPFLRTARSWVRRPGAGVVGATILAVSLAALAAPLGADGIRAIAGLATAVLASGLTVVDHGMVRFQTIGGHGSWHTIARHARGASLFALLAPLGCLLAVDAVAAGIVAIVAMAAVLLMAMRILAYRVHGRRAANLLVSLLVALLVLVAVTLPVALPLVVLAMLRQLQRHAAPATWMLA